MVIHHVFVALLASVTLLAHMSAKCVLIAFLAAVTRSWFLLLVVFLAHAFVILVRVMPIIAQHDATSGLRCHPEVCSHQYAA